MRLDARRYRLDDILRRPYTPETPFGASGDCVWATSPQGWGFRGGVHWVHPNSADGLAPFGIAITANGVPVEAADGIYRPSHVTLHGRDNDSELQIIEDKFITQDDVVVSVFSLRNPTDGGIDVDFSVTWGLAPGVHEFCKNLPVHVARTAPPGDDLRMTLPGGGRRMLVFAVAFAGDKNEARRRASAWASDPSGAVRHQASEYQRWFDENTPLFDCSDPWLTKLWYHRWHVVKKNHSNPQVGLTLEDTFSQGRWNEKGVSATITHGAGHVLRETRWLRDPRWAQNYFRGFARNQRADGLFRSWFVDGVVRPDGDEGKYADWITAGVWDVHLVHPDEDFLAEALPALEKNVSYWQTHSRDNDGLLAADVTDCPLGERRDASDVENHVKRLDLTSYQYANARALARVHALLGNRNAAADADALADTIKAALAQKSWDDETGFFYDVPPESDDETASLADLLHETDEKIKTAKTIAAFYPFYTGAGDADQARLAWPHLINPGEFWTAHPPASTSADSPAFSEEGEMRGRPLTGYYGNGPTWPHASSLVISGLARSLREHGDAAFPAGRETLMALINSFGRAQFEESDFDRPRTGAFYRGDTGKWVTDERDCNHSTWADLILTAVIGLVPRDDETLELHPLLPPIGKGGWSHFCVQNVPYRGRLLTIVWDDLDAPGDAYDDGEKGLTLYVNGRRHHRQPDLIPLTVELPEA